MFFFKLQFAHFITPSKYVNSNEDIFFKHVQDKFIHSDILSQYCIFLRSARISFFTQPITRGARQDPCGTGCPGCWRLPLACLLYSHHPQTGPSCEGGSWLRSQLSGPERPAAGCPCSQVVQLGTEAWMYPLAFSYAKRWFRPEELLSRCHRPDWEETQIESGSRILETESVESHSSLFFVKRTLKLGWAKQRATAIMEAVRGPDTPMVVRNSEMLGVSLKGTGRLASRSPVASLISKRKYDTLSFPVSCWGNNTLGRCHLMNLG